MKWTMLGCLLGLFVCLTPIQSGFGASELSSEYSSIASSNYGSYHLDDRELVVSAFIKSVNTWLRRYNPELISQGESVVQMRASYRSLYDLELELGNGTYKITARLAKAVVRKGRAQHLANHLSTGLLRLVEQELSEPKRLRQAEFEKAEQARLEKERALREEEEAREREARIAAAIAEDKARVAEMKRLGNLRAYPALAAYRYKKCRDLADVFLDADLKKFKELFESGLESVRTCSAQEEQALAQEVKLALIQAPAGVSDQIKDLHAYTVASLRALSNFHQSAIEARQARAERNAGIDERTTRVGLELQ